MKIGDETRTVGPGWVGVVPPNVTHSIRVVRESRVLIVDHPVRHIRRRGRYSMNAGLKLASHAAVLTLGLVLGVVAAYVVFSPRFQSAFAHQYSVGVAGQAFMASEIRAGREDGLLGGFEDSLPEYARALRSFTPDDNTQWALSTLKQYAVCNEIELPADLQDVDVGTVVLPRTCRRMLHPKQRNRARGRRASTAPAP